MKRKAKDEAEAAKQAELIAVEEAQQKKLSRQQPRGKAAAEAKAAEEAKAAAEAKAAEEAKAAAELARRQKLLAEVDLLRTALQEAMDDVKNPKQFVVVNKALKRLLDHPLFEGDATGQTGSAGVLSSLCPHGN